MFVTLAGPGGRAGVVEAQPIDLGKTDQQRRAILAGEQRFLRLVRARNNHEMVIDHIELVQQGNMGRREFRYEQVGVVG